MPVQIKKMAPKKKASAKRKRVEEEEEEEVEDDEEKEDDAENNSDDDGSKSENSDEESGEDNSDDDEEEKDEDDDGSKAGKRSTARKASVKSKKAEVKAVKKKKTEKKVSKSNGSSNSNGEVKERKPKQLRKYERLEEARKAYKWWEAPQLPAGINWRSLEHPAIKFPPEYIPHKIPILYDNKPVYLNSEQEEIASFYAAMPLDGPQLGNPKTRAVFQKNFFEDFLNVLGPGHVIKKFEKCNFDDIRRHLDYQKSLKKTASEEDKQAKKLEKEEILLQYGYALIDGRIEKMVITISFVFLYMVFYYVLKCLTCLLGQFQHGASRIVQGSRGAPQDRESEESLLSRVRAPELERGCLRTHLHGPGPLLGQRQTRSTQPTSTYLTFKRLLTFRFFSLSQIPWSLGFVRGMKISKISQSLNFYYLLLIAI